MKYICCPCCKQLIPLSEDDCDNAVVFFDIDEEVSSEDISKLGYEFGVKGGENYE